MRLCTFLGAGGCLGGRPLVPLMTCWRGIIGFMHISAYGAGELSESLFGTGRRDGRSHGGVLVSGCDDRLRFGSAADRAAMRLYAVGGTGRGRGYIPRAPAVTLCSGIRAYHLVAAARAGIACVALLGAGGIDGLACVAVPEGVFILCIALSAHRAFVDGFAFFGAGRRFFADKSVAVRNGKSSRHNADVSILPIVVGGIVNGDVLTAVLGCGVDIVVMLNAAAVLIKLGRGERAVGIFADIAAAFVLNYLAKCRAFKVSVGSVNGELYL